jgi:hypothetical protein
LFGVKNSYRRHVEVRLGPGGSRTAGSGSGRSQQFAKHVWPSADRPGHGRRLWHGPRSCRAGVSKPCGAGSATLWKPVSTGRCTTRPARPAKRRFLSRWSRNDDMTHEPVTQVAEERRCQSGGRQVFAWGSFVHQRAATDHAGPHWPRQVAGTPMHSVDSVRTVFHRSQGIFQLRTTGRR